MDIKYIYITEKSKKLCEKISSFFEGEIISYSQFKNHSKKIFNNADFLIFIMATGIVVRSISELLESKFTDPGVIVIDELGKNTISLLGGHIGGANELTLKISKVINSNPVITTATDINNKGSFDIIVKKINGYVDNFGELSLEINSGLLKGISYKLFIQNEYKSFFIEENGKYSNALNGFDVEFISKEKIETIILYIDKSVEFVDRKCIFITDIDLNNIKNNNAYFNMGKNLSINIDLKIDKCFNTGLKLCEKNIIIVIPKLNVLGIGCKRYTKARDFENNVIEYLVENNINISSIKSISSIDLKKDEKCILEFAKKYNIETHFYTKEEISNVDSLYEKSNFVKDSIGVYSVAEPSCHISTDGNVISQKLKKNGITISIGRKLKL
ncbi:cobalt-precorrin 5A hydrolase [Peptostreptococcus canis]|uniref:Cobalamin biosynthesis protein CbiG n=1 Tax=Peptostreptococcus canis TaxID=1159213 RepID=A0ABR6TJ15_9FIRM|nr:hypothetical protein [Peptostreptococcus canis]MBP1997512.1 cobalt-precorrin 5A hydrolase [Peptostreptococcus canis]